MIRAKVRTISIPTWCVFAAVLTYVVYVSSVQLSIHRGFGTSAYDIGLFDQGIWLLSRFKAPFVTLMGRNLFGDHSQLILLFVAPLYWIFPGIESIIVLQTFCIGFGAMPLYWFARRHVHSEWVALLVSIGWLINPAVVWTNYENFHPDSFLAVFIPLAIFGALERKWRLYAISCVLAVLVKEDVLLVLVPLGIYVWLARDRRIGVATVVGSLSATLAGMYLLMRGLIGMPTRNGWRIPFGGVWGTIKTAFTNPGALFDYLTSEGRLFYLWQLMAPFGGLFFFTPEIASISIVVVASNIISTFWYQFHINYHYTLVIIPALAFASITTIAKVKSRPMQIWCAAFLLMCTFASSVAWGPFPYSTKPVYYGYDNSMTAQNARAILKGIPADASLSVFHSFTPHVAHRESVYFWPNPFSANYYGTDYARTDGMRLPAADGIEYVILPVSKTPEMEAVWDREKSSFARINSNGSWELWERQSTRQPAG